MKSFALAIALLLTVTSCAQQGKTVSAPTSQEVPGAAVVLARVSNTGTLPMVATVKPDAAEVTSLGQDNAVAEAGRRLIAALSTIPEVTNARILEGTSSVAFSATAAALQRILQLPEVATVSEDYRLEPHLGAAVPIANLNRIQITGLGTTVVVVDSGVDTGHRFFLRGVREEACFTRNNACPNGTPQQIGVNSGVPCTVAGWCWHGTHVAGIADGVGGPGGIRGAAPDADLASIMVFEPNPGDPTRITAFTTSLESALAHVRDRLMLTNYVGAVNMSLGFLSATACTNPPLTLRNLIVQLTQWGVPVVISSGNDNSKTQVGFPACIPQAIAVGNALKTDTTVAADSNAGPDLDLLATGTNITSSVPGTYGVASGTSMAAPLIAGGIASLRSENDWPMDRMLITLRSTGRRISDNGQTYPRADFQATLTALQSASPTSPLVYIKDTPGDTGGQPDSQSSGRALWEAPDIWIRQQQDGLVRLHDHQNPEFGQPNFVYVQVRNAGGGNPRGRIVIYQVPAGGAVNDSSQWVVVASSATVSVPPTSSRVVEILWSQVPNPGHYCILAKWYDDGSPQQLNFSDLTSAVSNDRTLAWKNLNIIDAARTNSFLARFGLDPSQATNLAIEIDRSAPENEGWYVVLRFPSNTTITRDPTWKYAEVKGGSEEGWEVRIPIRLGTLYLPGIRNPNLKDLPVRVELIAEKDISRKEPIGVVLRMKEVKDVGLHKRKKESVTGGVTYSLKL